VCESVHSDDIVWEVQSEVHVGQFHVIPPPPKIPPPPTSDLLLLTKMLRH